MTPLPSATQAVFLHNGIMSPTQMRLLADRAALGGEGVEILRQRPDAMVARVAGSSGTVILKLWVRQGIRGLLRRVTRTGSVLREWRTLCHLYRAGVSVPKPLGYCRVQVAGQPYTDALGMEDLGNCRSALECVKTLARQGNEAELARFEDQLIGLTCSLLRAGFVDPDHSLVNTVVPEHGRPVRLDFELARFVRCPSWALNSYSEMIGRLIATYVFAVQPEVGRARRFATRLADVLNASRRVRRKAYAFTTGMLRHQQRLGIDVRFELDW